MNIINPYTWTVAMFLVSVCDEYVYWKYRVPWQDKESENHGAVVSIVWLVGLIVLIVK